MCAPRSTRNLCSKQCPDRRSLGLIVLVCPGYTSLSEAMTFKLVSSGTGGKWDYCTSAFGVPEQINVQIADPGSVVVSFVTFEVRKVYILALLARKITFSE